MPSRRRKLLLLPAAYGFMVGSAFAGLHVPVCTLLSIDSEAVHSVKVWQSIPRQKHGQPTIGKTSCFFSQSPGHGRKSLGYKELRTEPMSHHGRLWRC